jgi:hypothetical protein
MFNATHTFVGFAIAKISADKWVREIAILFGEFRKNLAALTLPTLAKNL